MWDCTADLLVFLGSPQAHSQSWPAPAQPARLPHPTPLQLLRAAAGQTRLGQTKGQATPSYNTGHKILTDVPEELALPHCNQTPLGSSADWGLWQPQGMAMAPRPCQRDLPWGWLHVPKLVYCLTWEVHCPPATENRAGSYCQ